ncbi:WD_REPEATS_REGION domain-containing protein, partial [Linnemannia exigua]
MWNCHMAKNSLIRPHIIGDGDDCNTTRPVRKRDKILGFLCLSNYKPKDSKNKTSSQAVNAQVSPKATGVHSVVSQSCSFDNTISLAPVSSADKPLPTLSTEATGISGVFTEDVPKPAIRTELPGLQDRIEVTQQLLYCNRLIIDGQLMFLSAGSAAKRPSDVPAIEEASATTDTQESDNNGLQEQKVDEAERNWIKAIGLNPIQQEHLRWLVAKVVEEFVKDDLKGSAAIAEVVILGPVLERDIYRSLLSCFIAKFEQDTILDVVLLQGIVQLIEGASPGYLEDDDLVRTLAVLRQRLQGTHKPPSEHVFQLTIAVSRLLDVMVNSKVKDVNSSDDHQPLIASLMELKDNADPILKFQVEYALQASQYIPDDESTLQAVLRFAGGFTMAALEGASVCKLDPANFFSSLKTLRQAAGHAHEATKSILEGMGASPIGRFGAMKSLLHGIRKGNKHEWYLTLLAAKTFVREGQLADFSQVVCEAFCRDERAFQIGVCQILGEIAMGLLWDLLTRQHAVDFLSALFRNAVGWKQHVDVKEWILIILTQLSDSQDASLKEYSTAVLQDLKQGYVTTASTTAISYSLKSRLPLPESSPLLTRVQKIPYLEYDLHKLRLQRLEESRQRIYIPPMAKPSLQAPDDSSFPLMDKVQEFLASSREVMLILGDSGAGKSAFNLELEHTLWMNYKRRGPIPLYINLPTINDPAHDLIKKQLHYRNFSDKQIQEMTLHREFVLICDGYDESQLKINLHSTNQFNRAGQRKVQVIVSCRSQYLGQNYRSRFQSQPFDRNQFTSQNFLEEAVITPFSKQQIEDYVSRFIPLEPRPWVKEEYIRMLTTIPNLMDLVKNPFLLTLALETLPAITEGKKDLSAIRIARVQLYDAFVVHWLRVNKRRLENNALTVHDRDVFDQLLDAGFISMGIDYSMKLALAIFDKQDGAPVIQYNHLRDKNSWKVEFFDANPVVRLLLESLPLTRSGNHFQFLHRSMLEYFFSRVIYSPAQLDEEFDPHVETPSPSSATLFDQDNPLFRRDLVSESSIILFLCDRVNLNSDFRQQLCSVIERSKTGPIAAIASTNASFITAATNAITILVRAGVSFNSADLRGIKIPGADLSGGQFDSAQFQGADLVGANLAGAWLRQANLSQAQLEGVKFEELPYLEVNALVKACAYSPDGRTLALAAGLFAGWLEVYDTSTWARIYQIRAGLMQITSIAFSFDGQYI